MKKLLLVVLSLLLAFSLAAATQNKGANQNANSNKSTTRKPIFRANTDQVKQAQGMLKQHGLYNGEQTGKLDVATRDGLKKYQQAESLKVTGTLNKVTLEKMGITLTDKQRVM